MNNLPEEIERCFGFERVPDKSGLVRLDGFDELEKTDAVKHYSGQSWKTFYHHLSQGELSWTNVRLEEWSVLEPYALCYFLRPYLMYLLDTLKHPHPNDEFVSNLYFQLSEVLRIRGENLFDKRQKELLTEIAGVVVAVVESDTRFDIWRNDIKENVKKCLSLLNTA